MRRSERKEWPYRENERNIQKVFLKREDAFSLGGDVNREDTSLKDLPALHRRGSKHKRGRC